MKLKYLTLYGFKSFPVRTRLQFSSGISAVVGPNGCGKSNVIDAIRWVLGEQSPAVLRAKGMEDLIYSGDRGRTVNFAEVTLGFETTGPLPVPELEGVTEVEIRRRLSRSGDSEYSINGRTCRLKDIHYLFMDTGAGNRAYSIVDQGQISRFVEMDAEERRDILNEAAGIARYKARRMETARRLAQTRENLERLNDILAEVDDQRKRLSGQAERTSVYLNLRAEQERLEKAVYASEWRAAMERMQILDREACELTDRITCIEAERNILLSRREEMSLLLLQKEEALVKVRDELSTKEDELRRLADLKNNQERLRFGEEHRLKTAQASVQETAGRRERAAARISALTGEIVSGKQAVSRLLSQITEGENGLLTAQKTRDAARDALEKGRGELVGGHAEYVRLDSQRRSQRAQIERLNAKLKAMEADKARIEREAGLKNSEIDAIKNRLTVLSEQLDGVQAKEQALKASLDSVTAERREVSGSRQQLHTRLSELRARLKALQGLEDAKTGYLEATKAILQQKGIKHMGIAADMLQVKPGCEEQAETVFSHTLQAVVLESLGDLQRVSGLVKNNRIGNARVFVRERLPELATADMGKMQDMIAVTGPLKAPMSSFLSRWDTAEDLETGLNAVCNGEKSCFITGDGDIVMPWGEVILRGRHTGSGIMARRAELAALKTEEQRLSVEYDGIVSREKALQARLEGLQGELGALRRQKEQFSQEQTGLLRNFERMNAQSEAQTERMERIALEMETAQAELLDLEIAIEATEQALEQVSQKKAEAEAEIQGKERALMQQENALNRMQKELETRRIALAEEKMRLASLEQEAAAAKDRLMALEREGETLQKEILNAAKRIEEIDKALEITLDRLNTQEQAVSQLRTVITDLQNDYYGYRDGLSRIQQQSDALQNEMQALQKTLNAKEVETAGIQARVETIVNRCQELFQVSVQDHGEKWIFDGFDLSVVQKRLKALNKEIASMGAVNLTAIEEFQRLEERHGFLSAQRDDLLNSIKDIEKAMAQINRTCRQRLKETLEAINERLKEVFPLLFEGGEATMAFTEAQDLLEAGVEYLIQLPGKRIQHLSLLSGGEKALAALALIFAIFLMKPSPFCLLDEVDAPLDGANTQRFTQLVRRIAHQSQMLLITHNQRVMEIADTLYGVTMEEKGVSKLVSVRLSNEA
jgi:chromosome segregation protein